MKKFSGKNRLAVIALAVMIGVAGYMSFADAGKDKKKEKTDKKQVEVINYEDLSSMAENENSQAVKDENGQTEMWSSMARRMRSVTLYSPVHR